MSLLPEPDLSANTAYLTSEEQNNGLVPTIKRVSFHTLGCRLNQSETDVLARCFEQQGYKVVPETEAADICVINTCTVTEHSDAKNRHAIRTLHRLNPEAMITVVGCYAQINPQAIARIDGVQLVIGNEEKMRITDYLEQVDPAGPPLIVRPKINKNTFSAPVVPHPFSLPTYNKPDLANSQHQLTEERHIYSSKAEDIKFKLKEKDEGHSSQSIIASPHTKPAESLLNFENASLLQKTRASLKIQDGCDFMCSFCIIPFARGRSRYREFENLQEEATMLVKEGAREIVITGVNVGTYQIGKLTIVDVIDYLNSLPGLARIRISSIEPTTVPEILFQYMNDQQHKLVPFFHLPIQSGDDTILKKMKRRYSAVQYADEIWRAFETVQDLCIGTDVMVGFPEESESEFENTFNLLNKLPLTYFHVFPFSAREGTPAFQLKEQIHPKIKQKRSERLRELSTKKRSAFHHRFLGETRNVLWESRKPDANVSGYTDNFIRVVLDEAHEADLRNKLLPVKLTEIKGQTMLGKISLGAC
jgi:threonylcarbamoyladenosine tRNA methylthiotransferase MtaB